MRYGIVERSIAKQKHMPKQNKKLAIVTSWRALPLLLAIVGLIGTAAIAHADTYDDQINALKAQNANSQGLLNGLQAQASSFQDAISQLQAQINAIQAQLDANQARQTELQANIVANQQQIDLKKQQLGAAVKAMYIDGQITTIEQFASSKNLSDYIDKEEYRGAVQAKLTATIKEINALQVQLQQQKIEVDRLLVTEKAQNDELAAQRSQQSQMLAYNQGQQDSYNQQLQANNAQISSLKAQQLAAYAAYARRNGVTQYGGDAGNGGYPSYLADAYQDTILDDWGMYNRECVSYVAWKIASTGRYMPYWGGRGNAYQWVNNADTDGIPRGTTPRVGSAVVWGQYDGLGPYGHVAYVEVVNSDNSIEVSQYNFTHGHFSRMHVPASDVSHLHFIYF